MEKKDHWKCPECTSKMPKTGNTNTPVRNTATLLEGEPEESKQCKSLQDSKKDDHNITHRPKDTCRPLRIGSVSPADDSYKDTCSPYRDTLSDLKLYIKELFYTHIDSIREAITDLTNTIKTQNSRMEQLEIRISSLESKSRESQQSDTSSLESVISKLQDEIAERDQGLLANDIEIAGCPEVTNENCINLITMVAKKVGVVIDEKDIVSAERVGPIHAPMSSEAQSRPRPLAVRLARRAIRDTLLQAARAKRSLNSSGLKLPEPIRSIYINERLSKCNRFIFKKARSLARELKYKYVWTREGKIYVRQEQGTPRIRLRNEKDIVKVFGKN